MQPCVAVLRVTTAHTPEVAIRRLVQAREHSTTVLSVETFHALLKLTAMAHAGPTEGAIVSLSLPTADLDHLESLGYIKLADGGAIELI